MPDPIKNKLLNLGFISMKFIGETHPYTSTKLRLFRSFNLLMLVFTTYFIFLNFFYVTGEAYIEALESFITISHVSILNFI